MPHATKLEDAHSGPAAAAGVRGVAEGDDFPPGSHLVTPRFGFAHHGIYVGNGRVVHYAGLSRSLRRGPVEEVSLAVFQNGKPVAIRDDVTRRYPTALVVQRARSRVGEDRYRVATNNCEHFCTWCLRGESRSEQIERFLRVPRVVATIVRRLAGAAVAGALRPTTT